MTFHRKMAKFHLPIKHGDLPIRHGLFRGHPILKNRKMGEFFMGKKAHSSSLEIKDK